MVPATHEATEDGEQHAVVVVQERVTRLGVLLDVMGDRVVFQRCLELRGCTPERAITGPEAPDDGAGALQERLSVLRDLPVIDTRCCESTVRGQQQCEPAA